MQGDRRRGFGRRGCFEVVLGKDDGTVESDVVLGKVHDGGVLSLENLAANYTDPDYLVNFAEN